MIAKSTTRIIIILSLIFIISCNGKKEKPSSSKSSPRIRKTTKVVNPKINETFVLGDTILFDIQSDSAVDSVSMIFENKLTVFQSSSFTWPTRAAKTGVQKFRLTVYSSGNEETHYPKVKILSDVEPLQTTFEIINEYPHNENSYTQGLFFVGDTLVESTGREGQSRLTKLNLNTGKEYQSISLPNEYFGEGSTIWNDKIIQLTWTSQVGFVYDQNLKQTGKFNYTHEGWGITTLGDTLIMSDGTEMLHLLDPRDFSEIGKLEVYTDKRKIINLNELEVIKGKIYANVWLENKIVVIDPMSGKVLETINMKSLKSRVVNSGAEAFNGIAYKPETDQIFVTGKLWPKIFEVKFYSN